MIPVSTALIMAYLITFILMPFIIKMAEAKKLYDVPDQRKTHTSSVSSLGGVGMIAGLSISLLLVLDFTAPVSSFQYYLAVIFIIFIIGVIDDLFVLHPLKKVAGQLVVAILLISKANLVISDMQGFAGIFQMAAPYNYFLTFFIILLVINSFNLIDGVDGLAACIGLVAALFFGVSFYLNGDISYSIMGFTLCGSLLAFLVYNFAPARIFMGDSGSMLIGVVCSILYIHYINTASQHTIMPVHSSLLIGTGVLLIPLLDVLRVFVIRLTKGVSPFAPDRNHLHHLMLNKGFQHQGVTITMLLSSLAFIGISILADSMANINMGVLILLGSFFAGVFIIKYFIHRTPLQVVASPEQETPTPVTDESKVLPLFGSGEQIVSNDNK